MMSLLLAPFTRALYAMHANRAFPGQCCVYFTIPAILPVAYKPRYSNGYYERFLKYNSHTVAVFVRSNTTHVTVM